jgi:Spy/CpxP family protein refolding chaperone
MKQTLALVALVGALATLPATAGAQPSGRLGRQGRQAAPPGAAGPLDDANVTPQEIRRMFDSYALMQAQDQLKITEEQFPKFLTRFKALQDLRRRALQERNRRLQELRRLTSDPQADETRMKEQVKALQELEDRSQADMRKAYEAIDQVLEVRQQARFRVFEEQMEQRMLQLITRARQANRPKP